MSALLKKTLVYLWFCVALFPSRISAQLPKLVVQAGHSGSVNSIQFSPDGRILASGSNDQSIELRDVATGRVLRTLSGHTSLVWSVAFSPDGRTLASGSVDNTIKLWEVASGRELGTLKGHTKYVWSVAFSPVGHTLASGSQDKTVKLWDTTSMHQSQTLSGNESSVEAVAFSRDGRILAGSSGNIVKLWDVATGHEMRSLTGHTGQVESVAFSHDGHFLASGSEDKTIKLWDVATGGWLRTLAGHTDRVTSVAFSSDENILASGSWDGTIRLWDVATGQELRVMAQNGNPVLCIAFSPDGRTLVSGMTYYTIEFWDVATGRHLRTFAGHGAWVNSVAFTPAGHILAAGGGKTIRLWDVTNGRLLHSLSGHTDLVWSVAFSPNGQSLASGSWDKTIKLWDVDSGRELRTLTGHQEKVLSIAFAADGNMLASGSSDRTVKLWDVSTGRELRTLPGGSTEFVAFSPRGGTLAYGSGTHTGLHFFDVPTGRESATAFSSPICLAFSPDGTTVASGSGNAIELWDPSGHELRTFTGHSALVWSVAFSPGGRILASGSIDNTIRLWDVAGGRELHNLVGDSNVDSVAFVPDGRVLASGQKSGSIQLWDVSTGRELGSLVAFNQSDWVVSDTVGRFDTNNLDEINGLSWVFPDDPFRALPPEIFMRDYYEPRLLPRLLAAEELPKVRPLGDLNRVQPMVKIVAVKQGPQNDLAEVTVEVSPAEGQFQRAGKSVTMRTDVYDLRLFRAGQLVGQEPELSPEAEASLRNGAVLSKEELKAWEAARKVKPVAGRVELNAKTGKLTRTFMVRLPHGEAGDAIEFNAYAFNEDRVKSETAQASYTVPKYVGPVKRRAYVVAMGVNAYQNPSWDLRFAVSDAARLQQALVQRLDKKQYEVVPVTLISDCKTPGCPKDGDRTMGKDDARKASLHAVLELLAGHPLSEELKQSLPPGGEQIRKAEPDDLVVLSISSHGYTSNDGMFYMIASDSGQTEGVGLTAEKVKALQQKWISSNELSVWLRDVDAGEMVMVVDTCHSAATVEEPGFKPGPMGSRGLGQLAYDKGMRILAASQANDVALESEKLKQGLLTYALVHDGLEARQAVKPGTEELTLDSWLEYGSERVPKLYEEVLHNNVQTFAGASKDVKVDEEQSPGQTSTLKKSNAFQQPSLFNFQKHDFQVLLQK